MDRSPRRHPHRGLTFALAIALTPGLGCHGEGSGARREQAGPAPNPETRTEPAEPPQVAVHGCRLIVHPERRRCLLAKPGTVSLWLAGRGEDEVRLELDGEAIPARKIVDREGLLLRVEIEEPAGTLALKLAEGAAPAWSIELARDSDAFTALRGEVGAAARAGELDRARELLATKKAELEPDEAALTSCVAARLAYGSEEMDTILAELADSPAVGCRGLAQVIGAHAQLYVRPDLNAAQRKLEGARTAAALDFRIALNAEFQQADLDLLVGEIDESLDGLDRVTRLAPLVDEDDLLGSAQVMKGIALARLGRFAEAEALARELESALDGEDDDDEVILDIRYNLAWIALLRREYEPGAPDPSETLERLARSYAAREDPQAVARTRLHIALAAVQGGELERAEATLAQVEGGELAAFELVWLELISARADLARGRADAAAAHLDRAQIFAELNEDLELSWHVWTARAELERAEGRRQAALEAHARAAVLADRLALSVPGTAGRSMVVTAHSRVDAEHVELLLELGRPEQALCVAAGTRARHLRALWARLRPPLSGADRLAYQALLSRYEERRQTIESRLAETWSLSTTQLAALQAKLRGEGEQADELLERATALLERAAPQWSCERILPHEAGQGVLTMIAGPKRERWWFMLARAGQPTRVVEIAGGTPSSGASVNAETLANRALAALAPELDELASLVVIPVAEFAQVDLHRLLAPTHPTLALRYSLGLGRGHEPSATVRPEPPRAAVVAGAADLDAVDREAAQVSRRLREQGWSVESSWSPIQAEQPDLLHYAGHGHHTGLAGWRSYIELPGFGRLSAAELVAAQRAPKLVVLGACSAGRSDAEVIDGGMNLAAAFLLAGADLVIAPSGAVEDEVALELAGALYRSLEHARGELLAAALAERQRTELAAGSSGEGPGSSLRWRVWTP
jgi:tetratricopeptide (TPR) repeat protein